MLRITITDLKNSLVGFKQEDERISKYEDRTIEINEFEKQKEK